MSNEKAIRSFQKAILKAYEDNKITEVQLENSLNFLREAIKLGYTKFDMSTLLESHLKAVLEN